MYFSFFRPSICGRHLSLMRVSTRWSSVKSLLASRILDKIVSVTTELKLGRCNSEVLVSKINQESLA